MKYLLLRACALVMLWMCAAGVQAAVVCTTLTSSPISVYYPANTTVALQSSFTITCTRDVDTEAAGGMTYTVEANGGIQPQGNVNEARLVQGGVNYDFAYDLYTTSCAGSEWRNNSTIDGVVTWPTGVTGPASDTRTFWFCVNTGVTPAASGQYTDRVALTATYNAGPRKNDNAILSGAVDIAVVAPVNCTIDSGPGSFALVYNAFQTSPLVSAQPFSSTCNANMPISLSVSPATGTLAGVNYGIDITDTGVGGTPITNTTGTGTSRQLFVRVTAPANQAGVCPGAICTASQPHTLTITY